MDVSLIVQGIIIGLILAVPVGPLSLMCIQRSLSDGRLHGIISGFGVATADSLYAAVAFLGLTVISGVILSWQDFFRFFAGLVLIIVGVKIFFTRPGPDDGGGPHGTYAKDYFSMVAIAIANPLTIIFLMVTLPGFGFVFGGTEAFSAAEFVGGFFCGSAAWWVFLCGSLGSVRSRISAGNLALINRVSGIFIAGVGAIMFMSLVLALGGTPGM
ncbi:MAG: LysE family transporter [Methanoregula sp.]|nr:LysE family transporter [Methanoregula sp.]